MTISHQTQSFYKNSFRKFSFQKLIVVLFFVVLISFTNYAYGASVSVPVGFLPFEVAINEVTKRAYVSHADGTVHVIDTGSATTVDVIFVGVGALTGIAVDPVENKIYVANGGSNELIIIDGVTKAIEKINLLPFGGVFPVDVEVNTVTKTLYVSNILSLVVIVIDIDPTHVAPAFPPTFNTVIDVIPGFDSPARFTFDPATNLIYLTNFFKNEVSVIDGFENFLLGGSPVLTPITVETAPDGIEINTVSKKIYIANAGSDTVSVIDTTTNTVVATISVGVNPVGVGVNEATNEIYVSNRDEGTLSVIDGESDTVVKTIPTDTSFVGEPPRPKGLDVDSDTGKPYVVNAGIGLGLGTLSIIDLSANSPPVARAGPDQVVAEGALVTLDGTGSSDADPTDPLFYFWTQVDPGSPIIFDPTLASPSFLAPLDDTNRLATFALIVDDEAFFTTPSLPDIVNIVINDKTTFDVSTTLENGVVSGSETIGDIFGGSTYTLQINGVLSSTELQQLVVPTGVDASGVTFDFKESSKFLSGAVTPDTGTALFLDLTFGGVDFSQSSNFESGIPPKVQFLVDSDFTSQLGSFADGCPVMQIQLFNEFSPAPKRSTWELIGDPQQANTNKIYVSNVGPGGTPGTLSVIDGSTYGAIAEIPVGFTPLMVDFDPNSNKVYVANQGSGTVSIIDGSTNTLITEIPVGLSPLSSPFEPIVNPNTGLVYVSNQGDVTVSVIDGSTNSVIAEIPVFVSPAGMGIDTTLNKIFVANVFSNSVSVIEGDPSSPFFNTVLVSIPTVQPSGIEVDSVNNIAYVSNFDDRSVSVIDTLTFLPKPPIRIGVNPTDLGYNPTTNTLFVANQGTGTVSIIDTKINAEIARIETGFAPFGIDVNPNTNRAFVSNRGSGTVSVIDNMPGSPTENTVIDTITGFSNNFGVTLNSDVPNPVRDPSSDVAGKCAYIAQPPHFSKFAVGGVALALAGLGGGGGSSGSAPVLNSISYDGVTTTNDDGTIGFGGIIIDEILPINNLPTQTVETGELFTLRLPFYEDGGVGSLQHVAVYFLRGDEKTIGDSQTSVIYEPNNPVDIFDYPSFISDVTANSIEKSAYDVDIIFEMVFNFPTDEPVDIMVRSWDKYKRSSDFTFNDFLQVIESDSESHLPTNTSNELTPSWSKSAESAAIKSTTIFREEFDGTQVTIDTKEGESVTKNFKIPLWVKHNAGWWSHDKIGDDDFVAGMQYLIEQNIMDVPQREVSIIEPIHEIVLPDWVKHNAGWWADDLVSDQEFVQAIEWLIDEGVLTV